MSSPNQANEPPTIVFVHGAWGGAHHWKAVADKLTADHGMTVRRASLTGLGERSHLASRDVTLATHIQDVVNVIEFDDLKNVTLVGHSYGGVVAAGVVDAIPDRIARVLYADSHLLDDGDSYFTGHPELEAKLKKRANEDGDGWLIPVDWPNPMRDTPHPLRTLAEPIKLRNATPAKIVSYYWLFTDGGPAEDDEDYRYLERAKQRGWQAKAFDWDHNPQRSRPGDFVAEFVKLLK